MSKYMQTVAAMACMKSLLMVFNFIFWCTGFIIFVVGVWSQIELYKYLKLSTEIPGTAPYVLIGTGALIMLIGSLACCCTIKGQPALLYMYGAFLALIFVLELGAGISIFAYRSKIAEGLNQGLNESMNHYNSGPQEKTQAFDWMQSNLHCCGVKGPEDWTNLLPPIPVPLSCCKEENCDTAEDDAVFRQGCYDKVCDLFDSIIGIVAGSAIGITFFPLIGLVLSCCLANSLNKAKYEQMA